MKCNMTARYRARYDLLRSMFNMTTWFCDAYASWQKGGIGEDGGHRGEAVEHVANEARCAVTILDIGTMDLCAQQIALRINGYVAFSALHFLARIIAPGGFQREVQRLKQI